MERKELKARIYARIDELPTLPTIIHKLLSLTENPKTGAQDIRDAISHDAALTAKILKVANSAYYGFPQEISDLERAVALLGFNMVKSLAISVGILKNMPNGTGTAHFFQEGLWVHSLAVGTGMKMMAERCKRGEEGESLFIVGLLHDIGKVVLDQFFADHFARILENVRTGNSGFLYQEEREIIGLDHGEVGGMLLERWKFPEAIRRPIAFHHQKGLPEERKSPDVAMLRVADAVVQELALGDSGNAYPPPVDKGDLDRLAIDTAAYEGWKKELEEAREGIVAFFGVIS